MHLRRYDATHTPFDEPVADSELSQKVKEALEGVTARTVKGAKAVDDVAKATNLYQSSDDLISRVSSFKKGKTGRISQDVIDGSASEIFAQITKGGKMKPSGAVEMPDRTFINIHTSTLTTEHYPTIDINKNGIIYKIRISNE